MQIFINTVERLNSPVYSAPPYICHLVAVMFHNKLYDVCCRLLEVRSRLYELMTHCIPPDVIMRVTLVTTQLLLLVIWTMCASKPVKQSIVCSSSRLSVYVSVQQLKTVYQKLMLLGRNICYGVPWNWLHIGDISV